MIGRARWFVAATDLVPGRLVRAGAFGLDLAMDVGSTVAEDRAAAILDAPVLAQSDGAIQVALDPKLPLRSASA